MQTDPFKEYLKQQEPDKKYKGYAWQTAIGLQAVDGLKPSEYLVDAAIQNIEGKITLDEVKNLLDSYYEEKPQKNHDRTEEAEPDSANGRREKESGRRNPVREEIHTRRNPAVFTSDARSG